MDDEILFESTTAASKFGDGDDDNHTNLVTQIITQITQIYHTNLVISPKQGPQGCF
jgi:hypothetical protein